MRQEEETSRAVSASGRPVADAEFAIAKSKETPTGEKIGFPDAQYEFRVRHRVCFTDYFISCSKFQSYYVLLIIWIIKF